MASAWFQPGGAWLSESALRAVKPELMVFLLPHSVGILERIVSCPEGH